MGSTAIAVMSIGAVLACGGGGPQTPPPETSPTPTAPVTPSRRLLVVTHTAGFRHGSIPTAETTLAEIGSASGVVSDGIRADG